MPSDPILPCFRNLALVLGRLRLLLRRFACFYVVFACFYVVFGNLLLRGSVAPTCTQEEETVVAQKFAAFFTSKLITKRQRLPKIRLVSHRPQSRMAKGRHPLHMPAIQENCYEFRAYFCWQPVAPASCC